MIVTDTLLCAVIGMMAIYEIHLYLFRKRNHVAELLLTPSSKRDDSLLYISPFRPNVRGYAPLRNVLDCINLAKHRQKLECILVTTTHKFHRLGAVISFFNMRT